MNTKQLGTPSAVLVCRFNVHFTRAVPHQLSVGHCNGYCVKFGFNDKPLHTKNDSEAKETGKSTSIPKEN